jgi:hypothetical protein
MRSFVFGILAASLVAACAEPGVSTENVDVPVVEDGKADAATETRVRAGETSLWVKNEIAREQRGERDVLVVRGRTSRDVTDGMTFVFDDVVGDWAKLSARTFEAVYSADLGGLLEGQDHFVRLQFKPSSGRPDSLTARVVARARLTGFGGTGVYLDADVAPVVYGGRVVWRLKGRAASKLYGLRVAAAGVSLTDVRKLDDTHFEIDLLKDHVVALLGKSDTISIEVDLASGTKTKTAHLALRLAQLGMTDGDAYEVWPPITCTDEVRECLAALPDGTLDTASCGESLAVRQCQGQVGVTFDDVAFGAAMDVARAKLADPAGFAGDVDALIGADRVAEYTGIVEQTVEGRLEGMFGRWFTDAAARDAAVATEVDGAIDLAYARPLDLYGEPHAPVAGNVAAERQAVADALLLKLDELDLEHTEFGRPLEVLARQYRAQHVEALRQWRTEVVPEPYNGDDAWLGHWLGAYVEVYASDETGAVLGVYFEID